MVHGRMLRILSIDAGILNLGWCVADACPRLGQITVCAYGNEDVTEPCRVPGCTLPHTKELWDRLGHVHEHTLRGYAEEADHVLLERQPPGGLGEVTAFFYSKYRAKTTYVHPRSMHRFYGMGSMTYDKRKEHVLHEVTSRWIPDLDCGPGRRGHDVADAVCMVNFFCSTARRPTRTPPPPPTTTTTTAFTWMDEFQFTGFATTAKVMRP